MPLLVRRNMNKYGASLRHFSQRISSFADLSGLPGLLLLVPFMLGGVVVAQAPELRRVVLTFKSSGACADKTDFSGSSININDQPVEIKNGYVGYVELSASRHVVGGLREPDYPNAKLIAVNVLLGGNLIKEYPVGGASEVIVTLDESLFSSQAQVPGIQIVAENDCGNKTPVQQEEPKSKDRKVNVFLKSLECDKTSYKSHLISLNDTPVPLDQDDHASEVPFLDGMNRITLSVPNYPNAKIKDVNIIARNGALYSKKEADFTYVELIVDDDLWDEGSTLKIPAIFLYTVGDCEGYEPPLQRLDGPPRIKVVSVGGNVTIFNDDSPAESPATNGSMIEDQQVIKTSLYARAELVLSDKRLLILGEGTVVKFNIRKSPAGVWEISAVPRSGSIETRTVGYRKGDNGYEWQILTATARITEKGTIYSLTYNETSKVTTVGVEQGQVTVTPANTSLPPFTLADHQMADVYADRVTPITLFFTAEDPKQLNVARNSGSTIPRSDTSLLDNELFLVGVGAVVLLGGMVVLLIVIYVAYRLLKRPPSRSAFVPAGFNAEPMPLGKAPTQNAAVGRHCPSPNCGKLMPATKKFCTACGTLLS